MEEYDKHSSKVSFCCDAPVVIRAIGGKRYYICPACDKQCEAFPNRAMRVQRHYALKKALSEAVRLRPSVLVALEKLGTTGEASLMMLELEELDCFIDKLRKELKESSF